MSDDRFDWSRNNEDVVFPTQQGIAVHENGLGEIVIRQEAEDPHDDDQFVHLPKERVPALIAALTRAIAAQPEALPAPSRLDRRPK